MHAWPVARVLYLNNKRKSYESALSTSRTVEGPSPDLFVDKTFEQSNLLTWNIVYGAVITRRTQLQNAFHRKTNRSMHFAVFMSLQCIMPGFSARISRKTFS